MIYDRMTRMLHAAIGLSILFQLLSEELMKRPKPGRVRTDEQILFFDAHEYMGIVILLLVLLRFVFVLERKEWRNLYPWLTMDGVKSVIAEIAKIPTWLTGKIPDASENVLAKTVHGLGLLLALGLGITGSIFLVGVYPDGSMPGPIHLVKELHEVFGSLLWIYVIGHVGMAVLHQLLGHKVLQRISPFASQEPPKDL